MAVVENHNIKNHDSDPIETREWLDSLVSVLDREGSDRVQFLLEALLQKVQSEGVPFQAPFNTAYANTIPAAQTPEYPGDQAIEDRIRAWLRWNAAAMVMRAGKKVPDVGGHIATFSSAAVLYEVGFNHFFHAANEQHGGDLVFIQGHSSPGIYARAFLEGRISEDQLNHFRQECGGKGISSYPHPWLMPDFWQFPTVSMGLGPLQAVYQARFMKYLENRGLQKTSERKVWCFCGDGEMDEPESTAGLGIAAREQLDNLIFVINCNLQRLDGPVRGNGKVIQEYERLFAGAGWKVIKVIWGGMWDELLARDHSGMLLKRMSEVNDGEYQTYVSRGGAYIREHFFGKYPETKALVANMTDEQIQRLNRGGHDVKKVYAAYQQAVMHTGQPVLILAKTIKGYGMGTAGEALNVAHQRKKMNTDELKVFRDRFQIPISDDQLEKMPYYLPAKDSPEIQYIKSRREALGGYLPARREQSESLAVPTLEAFDSLLQGSGDRENSTTMAIVRIFSLLLKDKTLGKRIVPIVPDESRTFGMEGLFRQIGIYSPHGQQYEPEDKHQLMYYREAQDGQILEEGINEAGAFCSWMAAGTSYSNHNLPMIPFYIYYSMFGFQRIGDFAWAAGDMQARGFLIGATAGRTTLAGEGLQHDDGHSHLMAATIPNCVAYDPTYAFEVAVIVQDGLRRMFAEQESVFYYLTVMNENYIQPVMPKGVESGILKGLYRFRDGKSGKSLIPVQLLGSGTILNEVIAAADLLESEYGVSATVWSATSFNELGRDGAAALRWNTRHPDETPRVSYVAECLQPTQGPIIAATDYMRAFSEQIRAYLPKDRAYVTLGTDGFGRSDGRTALREFFEVDHYHIAFSTLHALSAEGKIPMSAVKEAMKKWNINPDKPDPVTC